MFDVKISGLNDLQKELDQASRAFKALDGEIADLKFDPGDQKSIDAAISNLNTAIDKKVAPYRSNKLVMNVATGLKEKYREELLRRAAAARDRDATNER